MRYRSVILAVAFAALGIACSDDADNSTPPPAGDGSTTLPGDAPRTTTTLQLDTPTTFISDCAQMPAASALSGIVGIPLSDGEVIATGTCQFLGLNEQQRVITLSLFTEPGDQATFNDLQLSLGASTPLADPTLANAFIDPTSLVYINANGAIYTVRTLITDATPAEQVPLSVAVLHLWLGI